jgi:hypothetical protein
MTMRYALKHIYLITALTLGVTAGHPLYAQDALPDPSSVPMAEGVPASSVGSTSTVFVPDAMGGVPSAMPVAGSALPGSPLGVTPNSPLLETANQPQIVKDAVTGLQKTESINLDDMIRAQDAINRLDLLLEIEKRQLELKKIRDERTKPTVALGAAIPASALNLPSTPLRPASRPRSDDDDDGDNGGGFSSSGGSLDKYAIQRITGVNGSYMAMLMGGDDKVSSVKSGDTLSDGTKVKSISLTSVTLVKGKKSKVLKVPSDSYIVRGSAGHSGAAE